MWWPPAPKTIHDFGEFPQEPYQVQYPAPGDAALARRVQKLLSPLDVMLDDSWGQARDPYDWAVRFEQQARQMIMTGNYQSLIYYETLGSDATRSIPTPEHYLPLLYVLGATQENERVQFPVEGVDGGSISMLAVQVG